MMRDEIVKGVRRAWKTIYCNQELPLDVAFIFADSILDSLGIVSPDIQFQRVKIALNKAIDLAENNSVKPKYSKLHRPCCCGSQFQVFPETSKKDMWLFICNNESTFCELISTRIKAKTEEDAWTLWDRGPASYEGV